MSCCPVLFDLITAFKNGKNDFNPNVLATMANIRAVKFRTYSSTWSKSGLNVDIILAKPAALVKPDMISRVTFLHLSRMVI